MRTKLIVPVLMAALMAGLLLAGCTAGGEELKAQKAQLQQSAERLASLENQVKRLRDDLDFMSLEMNDQKQAGGGMSPEMARRIDEMSTKLSALEAGMGDMTSIKTALSAEPKPQSAAVASASGDAKPAAAAPAARPQAAGKYHKVAPNETLTSIAAQYGTTIAAIRKENGLPQNAVIRTGTTLFVPTVNQ